jgi:hypothetical protein
MKAKSAILYSKPYSAVSPADLRYNEVYPEKGTGPAVWVRLELSNKHFTKALNEAKPLPGETVLNSIPLT